MQAGGGQEPGKSPAACPVSSIACQSNVQHWAKAALLQTCLCRLRGTLHLGRDVFVFSLLESI